MTWSTDESAASGAFVFAIAGSLLVVAVGVLVSTASDLGRDDQASAQEDRSGEAEALLSTFLGAHWQWSETPGKSQSAVHLVDGALAADDLLRFQGVSMTANDKNGLVDYEEAHAALHVGDHAGFHIRIVPLDVSGLTPGLSGLRVAYIGDWTQLAQAEVSLDTDEGMVAAARGQFDTKMAAGTADERAALAAVGADFDDKIHLTAAAGLLAVEVAPGIEVPLQGKLGNFTLMDGDVFMDDPDYLRTALPSQINEYDVVVIGAGVDPDALSGGAVDTQLRGHVKSGGLLIALGGTEDTAWFDTTTAAMSETANPGTFTPDYDHPILQWPASVDWEQLDGGDPWPAAPLPDGYFHHILASDDDVDLAVSQAGSIDEGMAVVGSLGFGDDQAQGRQLLVNIMSYYARSDWFLDFGQDVPDDIPVAASMRLIQAVDEGGNQVPLRVTLHYWRA